MKGLLKGDNTDDDYGYWTFVLTNSGGKISVGMQDRGKDSHEVISQPSPTLDGQFHDLLTGTFKDEENDLDVVIQLSASH